MDNWIDSARKQRELDHITVYGDIHPKSDPRCFRRELLEELLDGLNYCQWSLQKGEISRSQFERIDRYTRIGIKLIEESCKDRFEWQIELLMRD